MAGVPPELQPTVASLLSVSNDKVKLEKGDRLTYRVLEDRLPVAQLVVNDAGEIDIPLIGRVTAMGKTCKQLAEEIKPLLEKEFYYKATVVISLITHSERSIGKIYVMGRVRLTGGIEIPAGETLTLSKAIARAQGFAEFADRENVRIIRKNESGAAETATYNVADIIDKGLVDKDPPVWPNDIIVVPEAKRYATKIYVLGRVNQPCCLDLQENEEINVSKSIARAQGFAEFADRERVKLLRKNSAIPWFTPEDFVSPGAFSHMVLTGTDAISKQLRSLFQPYAIAVLSDPKSPNQLRLSALITEMNRIINGDSLFDEKLFAGIKLTADSRRLATLDVKGKDIIRLNRYLLEDTYRGQIRRNRPPEYQVFVVNVAEILEKGLLDKDPPVLPNDTIVVPDNKRTNSKVSVMGQIRYPQSMEMLSGGNLTVSQVIAKAGGFIEFANKRKVKLMRRTPPEAYLFTSGDFCNSRRLAKRLVEQKDPLCAFLWERFTGETRQTLMQPKPDLVKLNAELAADFNHILQGGSIYTEDRFIGYKLPLEIKGAVINQTSSCFFTSGDFLDVPTFIEKLNRHTDPFFFFLWNQFSPSEQRIIAVAVESTRPPDTLLMDTLLARLNAILRGGLFYSPRYFEKIEISPEVLNLLAENPQGDDLIRLNRELMEDACPQDIKKMQYNPRDKSIIRNNRRLLENAFPRDIKRHDEYQMIIVDMQRVVDDGELDKDPLVEPDDLIMVPERWINF